MFFAGAEVLAVDRLIDFPRKQMIDALARAVSTIGRVFAFQKLANKRMRYRPRVGLRKAFELVVGEISGVGGNEVKELTLAIPVSRR
jgi:hypothetical protein